MKRSKRSVWHERSLAGKRGRPKSCPQSVWYYATSDRQDRCCRFRNGWSGARDRCRPWKTRYQLVHRGEWLGGLIRYADDGQWLAYVNVAYEGNVERWFWHRRDAKRWVAAESARRLRA